MASAAEARIREKAERLLRSLWPDARIVHEFDLGGVRLDLAAITEDRLIMAEIKSENDTLTRLENQVRVATSIGGLVFVMVAEKWVEKVRVRHPAIALVEDGDGFTCFIGPMHRNALAEHHISRHWERYDSRALMSLLLKPELYALAKPFGGKTKYDVSALREIAHENMNGRDIRRGVMAALRARHFGWTCDEPVRIAA